MRIIKHWILVVDGEEIKIPSKKLAIQIGKLIPEKNDVKFVERHLVWGTDQKLMCGINTKLIETNDFDRTILIRPNHDKRNKI